MMNTSSESGATSMSMCKERGAATLLVTLILLFAMTLGAFFAHRGMVVDQDVAGNHYRLARAFFAAEAGLELMVARLKVKSERDSILTTTGNIYTGIANGVYHPTNAHLGSVATAGGTISATVTIDAVGATGQEHSQLRITSRGCWDEVGSTNAACTTCSASCPNTASLSQVVAFRGGLAGVPSAALTAKGNVDLNGAAITVTNTDPNTNGLTVHAGGTIDNHSSSNLVTLPGTPPTASLAPGDDELSSIATDDYFEKFFGQSKAEYKAGADERITCGGVCNTSVNGKAGKIIWVDVPENGSAFTLNSTTVVGSATDPVVLIVNGPLELRGSATIYGVVYSTAILWDNTGGGTSQIVGAAIAEGDFTANGTPNPTFNADVLAKLSGQTGSYVKIPGTWRDF